MYLMDPTGRKPYLDNEHTAVRTSCRAGVSVCAGENFGFGLGFESCFFNLLIHARDLDDAVLPCSANPCYSRIGSP